MIRSPEGSGLPHHSSGSPDDRPTQRPEHGGNPRDPRAFPPAAGHEHGPEIRTPGPGTLAVTMNRFTRTASGCHCEPVHTDRQRLSLRTSPHGPPAAVTTDQSARTASGCHCEPVHSERQAPRVKCLPFQQGDTCQGGSSIAAARKCSVSRSSTAAWCSAGASTVTSSFPIHT